MKEELISWFFGKPSFNVPESSDSSVWVIGVRGMSIYSSGLNPLYCTWDCCYDYFLLCFACVPLSPAISVSQATSEIPSYCLSHSSPSSFSVLWFLLDAGALCICRIHCPFFALGLLNCHHHNSGRLEDKKIARESKVGIWLWTSTKD